MTDAISIHKARTHNLKNISLRIPRNKFVIITGLSGSGKSSLAFDTLHAEGQRRYVESLPAYVRQFLPLRDKPDVDRIDGLSPAIAIEQKTTSHNPRSTVGTVTEINDYLRLLYARVGEPHCPHHPDERLTANTLTEMLDAVLALPDRTKIMLLAPLVNESEGEDEGSEALLSNLKQQGFVRVRINGEVRLLDDKLDWSPESKPTVEVVVDRLKVRPDIRLRLAESIETTLALSQGGQGFNVASLAFGVQGIKSER